MGFPVSAGNANYSASGAGNTSKFIPQLFSGKLVRKFYETCIYMEIANMEYEGEIKSQGDKVTIRTRATVTTFSYTKGQGLTYTQPESPNVELNIDKGEGFAIKHFKIDEVQSDIRLLDEFIEDANKQVKIAVDREFLSVVPSRADPLNAGATAGKISGDINLGTALTPLSLNPGNILEFITQCSVVLEEQNIPDDGECWMVLPAKGVGVLRNSDLKDASLSGDSKSTLRTGLHGKVDRFKIIGSNTMNVTGGVADVIFGHKSAITFAGQIDEFKVIDDPNDFGKLARGLFVYGYEVIKPDAMGNARCSFAFS